MFSNGSSSSMSRAMVTPSLVMVGEPNFLSRTTLRPLGPMVTLTASARWSMPRLSERRAVSSKMSCLANSSVPPGNVGRCRGRSTRARQSSTIARMSFWLTMRSSSPSTLNSVPAYLAYRTLSPSLTSIALRLPSSRMRPGPTARMRALLRLLLGGVRQDDAALGHLLAGARLDDDAVAERAKLRSNGGSGFGQRAVPPVTAGPAVGHGRSRTGGRPGYGADRRSLSLW